jgi:hypothetical protein
MASLLSLHPYFGTLLPCLKEMTKDFIKFLGLVAILYLVSFHVARRDGREIADSEGLQHHLCFPSAGDILGRQDECKGAWPLSTHVAAADDLQLVVDLGEGVLWVFLLRLRKLT